MINKFAERLRRGWTQAPERKCLKKPRREPLMSSKFMWKCKLRASTFRSVARPVVKVYQLDSSLYYFGGLPQENRLSMDVYGLLMTSYVAVCYMMSCIVIHSRIHRFTAFAVQILAVEDPHQPVLQAAVHLSLGVLEVESHNLTPEAGELTVKLQPAAYEPWLTVVTLQGVKQPMISWLGYDKFCGTTIWLYETPRVFPKTDPNKWFSYMFPDEFSHEISRLTTYRS